MWRTARTIDDEGAHAASPVVPYDTERHASPATRYANSCVTPRARPKTRGPHSQLSRTAH